MSGKISVDGIQVLTGLEWRAIQSGEEEIRMHAEDLGMQHVVRLPPDGVPVSAGFSDVSGKTPSGGAIYATLLRSRSEMIVMVERVDGQEDAYWVLGISGGAVIPGTDTVGSGDMIRAQLHEIVSYMDSSTLLVYAGEAVKEVLPDLQDEMYEPGLSFRAVYRTVEESGLDLQRYVPSAVRKIEPRQIVMAVMALGFAAVGIYSQYDDLFGGGDRKQVDEARLRALAIQQIEEEIRKRIAYPSVPAFEAGWRLALERIPAQVGSWRLDSMSCTASREKGISCTAKWTQRGYSPPGLFDGLVRSGVLSSWSVAPSGRSLSGVQGSFSVEIPDGDWTSGGFSWGEKKLGAWLQDLEAAYSGRGYMVTHGGITEPPVQNINLVPPESRFRMIPVTITGGNNGMKMWDILMEVDRPWFRAESVTVFFGRQFPDNPVRIQVNGFLMMH